MKFENLNIVIVSPEPWGDIWLSKHHYAKELSSKNRVLFLSVNTQNESFHIENKNLVCWQLKLVKGLSRLPNFITKYYSSKLIRKIKFKLGWNHVDVVWSFDPFVLKDQSLWGAKVSIYHAMDLHLGVDESAIIEKSNYVFAPSDLLLDRIKGNRASSFFKINHAVDQSFIDNNDVYTMNDKLKIGYVGNLRISCFAFNVFKEIVTKNPDVEFHLAGPNGNSNIGWDNTANSSIDNLLSLQNVTHHGVLDKPSLISFMKGMDGFLLCYDDDPIRISNSHKILEYLSTGKVVFSGPIAEYLNKPELIIMSDTIEDLPGVFNDSKRFIKTLNSKDRISIRKRFAEDNLYSSQIAQIENLIQLMDR